MQAKSSRSPRLPSINFRFDSLSALFFTFTRVVLENVIHLLQRPTLSFWNEEECPDTRQKTEDCEEDVCAFASVFDERRGDQADDEIVQPV